MHDERVRNLISQVIEPSEGLALFSTVGKDIMNRIDVVFRGEPRSKMKKKAFDPNAPCIEDPGEVDGSTAETEKKSRSSNIVLKQVYELPYRGAVLRQATS